jgi:16S rRNA (adenine1518-N6/adenine1519-N6)-dimethyltransferase
MHIPRKRFGQHFLHDKEVIKRLVDVIAPVMGQHLVEIGPGQGVLTLPILKKVNHLDVIELDRDLIPTLTQLTNDSEKLIIHQADALRFDFSTLYQNDIPLRIFGNLPYNISTPLIFHLLTFIFCIHDMHFMLQKEVVDRLAAKVGCGDYGRLSIMVQYFCEVYSLFDVAPESFNPPPRVNSSIVRIIPHKKIPYHANDFSHFAALVKQAFNQRRKTLRNCLKNLVHDNDWQRAEIDPSLRPEQLTIGDYVKLSNTLR